MLKSAFGGLSTGVCRQPHWSYVGVFMYSLAGWSCKGEIGLRPGCGCVTGRERNIIHADTDFSCSRVYPREIFSCTRAAALFRASAGFLSLHTTRGTIPHIIPNYPRAHYNAGLNTSAAVCRRRYLVSVRNLSTRCACNQTKVCRRKCSDRRLPNESVPTEVF